MNPQSRKQFVQSLGATCNNWNWSWSFVNHSKRFVLFGVWDRHDSGRSALILARNWEFNQKEGKKRKQPGYQQSLDHIQLVVSDGYTLKTFPMVYSAERQNHRGEGPAKIGKFIPIASDRRLLSVGNDWYAVRDDLPESLAEELQTPENFSEGARVQIVVNAIERSSEARKRCLEIHGHDCKACSFNFENVYGSIGSGFIHVHHVHALSQSISERSVDPEKDLVPLCPNCHALVHRCTPPLSINELKNLIFERSSKHRKG